MTNLPLKIALIGCGRIAGHHCQSIGQVDGVELAAVCDLDVAKAKAYGDQFSVPHFTDYHDMFQAVPEIDIAAVITPSGMHFEHGADVIERYKKHLIMEKPTFMRPEQLHTAYDAADQHGLQSPRPAPDRRTPDNSYCWRRPGPPARGRRRRPTPGDDRSDTRL